ncbi:MAG: phosphotransferase [Actinomycetia bacterium]|nr:phosphotransferase [Actinomycetes bacterium]
MAIRMHDEEVNVNEALVRTLLVAQMPNLADQPLTKVEPWGTDNAIWRLGDDLVVRLPRIHWATGQIDRDATWLPRLALSLPVPIPEPIAIGEPGSGYPYRWALHRWIPGEGAKLNRVSHPETFALELADFVQKLQVLSTDGAPAARNRARPLHEYDPETRRAIDRSSDLIDADAATAVWEEALAAPPFKGPPVWVHGDLEGWTGVITWNHQTRTGFDPLQSR